MLKETEHDDLERAIQATIEKLNLKYSIHTAPVYRLADVLAQYKITWLRMIGRSLGVKYYGKVSKDELIKAISVKLVKKDNLLNLLYLLSEDEMRFFLEVAKNDQLEKELSYLASYTTAQNVGILQCYHYSGKLWFVVPDEIKDGLTGLIENGFLDERRHRDRLNECAIAAVNLYGVISQEDFVKLFNDLNETKTSMDEINLKLIPYLESGAGYYLWSGYIVEENFKEDHFKGVLALLDDREGKEKYEPSKEEFLKYSDWDYYEQTPQIEAFRKKLSVLIDDEDTILDIIDEIHYLIIDGTKISRYMDVLNEADVIFSSMDEANETIQLMMEVGNNTRLWSNYGHTPNELFQKEKKYMRPLPSMPFQFEEVGRNEPCPCGSGKKYKHCCGKDLETNRYVH